MAENVAVKTTKRQKMAPDVAGEIFEGICEDLGIDAQKFKDSDKDEATRDRLVGALCSGQLEYADGSFKLNLLTPIKAGDKQIQSMTIVEPDGVQLRSMSEVKKKNDDVGKAMAVLGSVTELGLPTINKLKSRDLMVGVEVIGLFL